MESIMTKFINDQVQKSIEVKQAILKDSMAINTIRKVAQKIIEAYKNGNKTLIAGNGGSAADAQHIAAELVSKFYFNRPGLASLALTTNTSILTSVGNDYAYDKIFSRQIQANGIKNDIFIGLSTSGNSNNIIEALQECKIQKVLTVGMTGQSGGKMAKICDYCIQVPSFDTPRVQEAHILIGHILCSIVEEALFGKGF